ncbi:hypothetical protein [Mycoplasmopsis primatum]|uniref:hypothetical protein n=1 Tax=Mycoplasmopsis primatum TaxID=55604 RepID=UPI0004972453|nr:hypothetical protein [Mycoplasmopsis primatum]
MQNNNENLEQKIKVLPILKPIALVPEFVEKVKGDNKLKTNVIVLIAEDENCAYFVSGMLAKNEDEDNQSIVNLDTEDGILDNGETANILLAKSIDLSVIYKMDYDELISKIQTKWENMARMPYLSIKDQLSVVNAISENITNQKNLPKLVLIRKKKAENNAQASSVSI